MQAKGLVLIVIVILLNGCYSSTSEIIVVDKSINQNVEKVSTKLAKNTPKTTYKNTKDTTLVKNKAPHNWLFPVTNKVIKTFSKQHPGISFDTNFSQIVRASAAGIVIYSDNKTEKYGKMVIIKHPLGFYSLYAKNHSLEVKPGDKVTQGKIIALTGEDDFYFEMRKFKTSINPLEYLQQSTNDRPLHKYE